MLPVKPELVFVKVPMVAMSKSPFVYLSRANRSLDGSGKAGPAPAAPAGLQRRGRRPCRCFLEHSAREEWRSQGKKLRQAKRRLLRPRGGGTANFHHERQRWMRGARKGDSGGEYWQLYERAICERNMLTRMDIYFEEWGDYRQTKR